MTKLIAIFEQSSSRHILELLYNLSFHMKLRSLQFEEDMTISKFKLVEAENCLQTSKIICTFELWNDGNVIVMI